MNSKLLRIAVLAVTVCLLTPLPLLAVGKKLVLKDGTYQIVREWQVKGERVRYYSIERFSWEELPASLVDWEATKKANEQAEAEAQELVEEARQPATEETGVVIVAPGKTLPKEDGVYAFDGKNIVILAQSATQLRLDKKRMLLSMAMPVPVLKSRTNVTLEGVKSKTRLRSATPTLYIRFGEEADLKFGLVRAKVEGSKRIFEQLLRGPLGGKAEEGRHGVAIEQEMLAPGIYRLKPLAPLAPGEYAVIELLEQGMNLDLWDFGVDR
jgi:hypothetical protein